MKTKARATAKLALCLALLEIIAACASAPPTSPQLLAYCTKMHRLWMKYEAAENPSSHAQHAPVDLALHRCQRGRYEEGISQLERILRRDLIPLPNGPSPSERQAGATAGKT
jgi:predicted component of type VI protein secretion system